MAVLIGLLFRSVQSFYWAALSCLVKSRLREQRVKRLKAEGISVAGKIQSVRAFGLDQLEYKDICKLARAMLSVGHSVLLLLWRTNLYR